MNSKKKSGFEMQSINRPSMLEIICRVGSREDLGRPTIPPIKSNELLWIGYKIMNNNLSTQY